MWKSEKLNRLPIKAGLLIFVSVLVTGICVILLKDHFDDSSSHSHRLNQIESLTQEPIHWVVRDIYGKKVMISGTENFKGMAVNLWATWCPPCIEELVSLSDLAERSGPGSLVVAVTTEPLETVQRFIKTSFPDLSARFKIVSVSPEEQRRFFPADSLPVTYLFNKNGLLVRKVVGARDWGSFRFKDFP